MFHTYHPSFFSKKSQSSIRHQVRKLRAKVRTLIPQQCCQHYQKRNNKLTKFSQKLKQNKFPPYSPQQKTNPSQLPKKHIWRHGLYHKQQWYTDTQNHRNPINKIHQYQFNKLKQQQLKQINQDKIYYLGQNNIDTYNHFLKTHSTLKINKKFHQSPQNNLHYNSQKYFVNIDQQLSQHHQSQTTYFNSRFKSTPIIKNSLPIPKSSLPRSRQYSSQKQVQTEHKIKQNQLLYHNNLPSNRKQQVQQQQKKWQLHHKIKIDIQMLKYEQNIKQLTHKQSLKIQQNKCNYQSKYHQYLNKKNTLMKTGQIIKLDQQLRSIIIKRKNNRNIQYQSKSPNHAISQQL